MNLKTKLFLKRLNFIIYCLILLGISFVFNRFYQMLIFLLLFNFIQDTFIYRFHADTIIEDPIKALKWCKVITITIHILYLIFCKNLNYSIYSNLCIIILIALLNCLLEFSIQKLIIRNIKLCDYNTLIEMCEKANLSYDVQKRLIMKYIQHKTNKEIAQIECVDEQAIKMTINRSLKKFKELKLID